VKYLLVVLVVMVVVWIMARPRSAPRPPGARSAGSTAAQSMVQCQHCGVHLPRAEALFDQRGVFCSEAHRLAGPRSL